MTEKVKNSEGTWLSNIGVVNLGKSFKTYQEVMEFAISDTELDLPQDMLDYSHYRNIKELISQGMSKFPQPIRHMDTSVGGCDIFNPYYQYGRDDDIIHPLADLGPLDGESGMLGMGSIYSKSIYDNQRVLRIAMGVPRFSKLTDFFLGGDTNNLLTTIMRDGEFQPAAAIGALFTGAIRLAFKIPFIPITVMNWLGEVIIKDMPVVKYYDFKNTMLLYFRLVNSIFSVIVVSMGIYGNGGVNENTAVDNSPLAALKAIKDENMQEALSAAEISGGYHRSARAMVPEFIKEGPSIFKILNKLNRRMGFEDEKIKDDIDLIKIHQEMTQEEKDKGNSFFGALSSGILDQSEGRNNFIGFRIEKNADASESISNSTGESEVAQSLNSVISQQRNLAFKFAGGEIGMGVAGAVVKATKDFWEGAMAGAGLGSMSDMITGNGYFDIPHEWKNSEFTKNHSFSIPLRARYGDPVSIVQDLYLPLALWLAAGTPRQTGKNMYTSPFLVQAYCEGLFSVPLGMIKSINIKRGGPEFGWSVAKLPLSIDLDVEIQDLSPVMFLSLTSNEVGLFNLLPRNTAMLDYISTLSGIGLYSRNTKLHAFYRQKMSAFLRIKNTLFDPYFLGAMVGDIGILKGLMQITPLRSRPEKHSTFASW